MLQQAKVLRNLLLWEDNSLPFQALGVKIEKTNIAQFLGGGVYHGDLNFFAFVTKTLSNCFHSY